MAQEFKFPTPMVMLFILNLLTSVTILILINYLSPTNQ